VQERLHAEVQKALQTKDVRERMSAVGGDVIPGSADITINIHSNQRRQQSGEAFFEHQNCLHPRRPGSMACTKTV
jgi:hypothetical protein